MTSERPMATLSGCGGMARWHIPPILRRRSYLLHVWEERSTQPPYRVLRLSVESPHSERRGFESPEALARFLSDVADVEDRQA
jgi:hypothetical protein